MERMVNKRLMWVLESKGLLASEQCGFRREKKHSSADQLVRFDSFNRNAFAKKEKRKKKNTFLPFSLTWKKPTTQRGNTVYCPIFTILIFEAIFLPWLMGSCPIGCFRRELAPLCPIRMIRRWVFLKEAYYLRFFSVLKLAILSSLSWKVWKCYYSWMILPFLYVQSSSHMHSDLCNGV